MHSVYPLTLDAQISMAPDITAGLDTVARMPSHPVASALIRRQAVPAWALSANSPAGCPTLAKHVIDDLMGKVDVIRGNAGVESTVLDITVNPPYTWTWRSHTGAAQICIGRCGQRSAWTPPDDRTLKSPA